MAYAIRASWPDDPSCTDDYVIQFNGYDVGRVYKTAMPTGDCWQWTIFINQFVRGDPDVWVAGHDADLDEAIKQFVASFASLIAADKVLIA